MRSWRTWRRAVKERPAGFQRSATTLRSTSRPQLDVRARGFRRIVGLRPSGETRRSVILRGGPFPSRRTTSSFDADHFLRRGPSGSNQRMILPKIIFSHFAYKGPNARADLRITPLNKTVTATHGGLSIDAEEIKKKSRHIGHASRPAACSMCAARSGAFP